MNKLNILFFLAALILLAPSCKTGGGDRNNPDGYVITGRLTGVPSGTVKLQCYNDANRTSKVMDSITFEKGSFEMKGKLVTPQMMTLIVDPGNWTLQVFLENGNIRIKADTAGAEHFDYSRYKGSVGATLKNYTVTGSKSHDDYLRFQNDPENLRFKSEIAGLNKVWEAEKDPEKKELMLPRFDSIRDLSNAFQKEWINKYVSENPTATAGAYLFSQYYLFDSDMPLVQVDSILNKFAGEVKSSSYFQNIASNVGMRKALLPGHVAPDFTLLQRDSSLFTLSSLRGRYVMIDFWASWCKPCREAIPHWKEIYKAYHSKEFEIVSVSDDSRWNDWTHAMDVEKMPWIQVIDEFPVDRMPARVGTLYMTHYIPFYVLLDKEGVIILYTADEQEISLKLEELYRVTSDG